MADAPASTAGAALSILGAEATSGNSDGGQISITGGAPNANGVGGAVSIIAADAPGSGAGGSILLRDDTSVPTAANIATGIVLCTPTADRSRATDTAANLVSGLTLSTDGDSFDFSFINLATDGTSHITLTAGTGITLIGCMVISAQDLAEDAFTSGTAQFRIRRTASNAVTFYRIG